MPKKRKELEMLTKPEQDKVRDDYFSMPIMKWGEKYGVSGTIGRIWFGKKGYNHKANRGKSHIIKKSKAPKQPEQVRPPEGYYNFTKTREYAYLPR